MQLPRIIIIGFMAAGKTTVARALAAQLACVWLDLDAHIVTREGRVIAALIAADGEARFREIETELLGAALATDARIIALGGGAWTVAANRALIAQHNCITVWLDAPFELCWQRINNADDAPRPLAPDRAQARRRYDARRATYQLAAHHIHISAKQSAAEIAREILTRLKPTERIPGGLDYGQGTDEC